MSLCEALHQQDQPALDRLKRNSIYLQADDTDHDFEFFVFVDAANEERRPLFLQALRVALDLDTASRSQVESQCRQDWDERFQGRPNAKPEFSLLNWLKIAIEDYPFRLFIVIDPEKWKSGKSHPFQSGFWKNQNPFLLKRICFIDDRDFDANFPEGDDIDKASYDRFKNWLYAQWVLHLMESTLSIDNHHIRLRFHNFDQEETFFIPATAHFFYKPNDGQMDNSVDNENKEGKIIREISMNCKDVREVILSYQGEDITENVDDPFVFLSRHTDLYKWSDSNNWWDAGGNAYLLEQSSNGNYWASYNLSGALLSFVLYQDALSKVNSDEAYRFFLSVAEHALIRTGIADERFQEWYETMSVQQAASLFQSRIVGVYCFAEKDKLRGQGDIPNHNIFVSVDLKKEFDITWGKGLGKNFSDLWKQQFRKLDMIIIHQGLLDKFKEIEKNKSIEECILEWKEVCPWIIITSGRGKPEDVSLGTKFLPFSGLESCMIGKRFDKHILLRQIISI